MSKSKSVLQAANNWIILKSQPPQKETKLGLISVIEDKEQWQGEVVAAGPDVDFPLKNGDTVIWGQFAGKKLYINNQEYIAIRATDVVMYSSQR